MPAKSRWNILATDGNTLVRINPGGSLDTTFGTDGYVDLTSYRVYVSAILVESGDDSIVLPGSGGMVFLNSDGSLNASLGDPDGMGGRTEHVVNSNIGFVTEVLDADSSGIDGFVITSEVTFENLDITLISRFIIERSDGAGGE